MIVYFRVHCIALLLLCCSLSYAGLSVGIDLRNSLSVNTDKTEYPNLSFERSLTTNSFFISPRIGILPSELLEISPAINFGVSIYTSTVKYDTDETKNSSTQIALGAGCGVYFHLIRGDLIHLSLGPKLVFNNYFEPSVTVNDSSVDSNYTSYVNLDFSIAIPVNIDLHLNEHFSLRLSADVISYEYDILRTREEDEFTGEITEVTNKTAGFDIYSIFQPAFGFIIYF